MALTRPALFQSVFCRSCRPVLAVSRKLHHAVPCAATSNSKLTQVKRSGRLRKIATSRFGKRQPRLPGNLDIPTEAEQPSSTPQPATGVADSHIVIQQAVVEPLSVPTEGGILPQAVDTPLSATSVQTIETTSTTAVLRKELRETLMLYSSPYLAERVQMPDPSESTSRLRKAAERRSAVEKTDIPKGPYTHDFSGAGVVVTSFGKPDGHVRVLMIQESAQKAVLGAKWIPKEARRDKPFQLAGGKRKQEDADCPKATALRELSEETAGLLGKDTVKLLDPAVYLGAPTCYYVFFCVVQDQDDLPEKFAKRMASPQPPQGCKTKSVAWVPLRDIPRWPRSSFFDRLMGETALATRLCQQQHEHDEHITQTVPAPSDAAMKKPLLAQLRLHQPAYTHRQGKSSLTQRSPALEPSDGFFRDQRQDQKQQPAEAAGRQAAYAAQSAEEFWQQQWRKPSPPREEKMTPPREEKPEGQFTTDQSRSQQQGLQQQQAKAVARGAAHRGNLLSAEEFWQQRWRKPPPPTEEKFDVQVAASQSRSQQQYRKQRQAKAVAHEAAYRGKLLSAEEIWQQQWRKPSPRGEEKSEGQVAAGQRRSQQQDRKQRQAKAVAREAAHRGKLLSAKEFWQQQWRKPSPPREEKSESQVAASQSRSQQQYRKQRQAKAVAREAAHRGKLLSAEEFWQQQWRKPSPPREEKSEGQVAASQSRSQQQYRKQRRAKAVVREAAYRGQLLASKEFRQQQWRKPVETVVEGTGDQAVPRQACSEKHAPDQQKAEPDPLSNVHKGKAVPGKSSRQWQRSSKPNPSRKTDRLGKRAHHRSKSGSHIKGKGKQPGANSQHAQSSQQSKQAILEQ